MGLDFGGLAALDAANKVVGRELQLGHIADTGDGTVRQMICDRMYGLIPSCTSRLQIRVASAATMAGITPATITTTSLSPTGYSPGTNGSYVIMQVGYLSPYGVSFIGPGLSPISYQVPTFMITSTTVFQNEPSSSSVPGS